MYFVNTWIGPRHIAEDEAPIFDQNGENMGGAADGWIRGRIEAMNLEHRDALFPIPLWNMVDRVTEGLCRTNNSVEGWHATWNVHLRGNQRLSSFARKMIEEDTMWEGRIIDYQLAPANGIRGVVYSSANAFATDPDGTAMGCPIELKIQRQQLQQIDQQQQLCAGGQRLQMDTFLAWGCIGDFARPYLTIQAAYVARQLELFDKGLVRRAFQPVYWSPSSRTALAESELFGPQKYGGLLPLLAYQL
uniref:Aminoacyl-tRNA synthetase class Ia domain-containing protein n=1 Tax=Globodera rostochiensis TaxID=31243 RepID=A0A914HJE3_GLORO